MGDLENSRFDWVFLNVGASLTDTNISESVSVYRYRSNSSCYVMNAMPCDVLDNMGNIVNLIDDIEDVVKLSTSLRH